jgi:hypothetical protein
MSEPIKPKAKRGRKSKKDVLLASQQLTETVLVEEKELLLKHDEIIQSTEPLVENDLNDSAEIENTGVDENTIVETAPVAKKRGRKPKGGKIIQQPVNLVPAQEEKVNIILHLKCSMKDLYQPFNSNQVESFNSYSDLSYEVLANEANHTHIYIQKDSSEEDYTPLENKDADSKELWKKLKQLEHSLHVNNVSDKKSACFWCTYEFDNPPIYIPKHFLKDSYHVYGCFCSPECSVAYLMEENIDSSTKFERYHLLNHIYAKIYDYTKNIKPAPNPYYMLDKYYGNLTIQEYRALLSNDRLFLIVNKPLTRIMPELHQDNEDFIINNKIIPTNNYNVKKKLQKKPTPAQSKNSVISEKFGIGSTPIAF